MIKGLVLFITTSLLLAQFVQSASAQTLTLFALSAQSINNHHIKLKRCNLDDIQRHQAQFLKLNFVNRSEDDINAMVKPLSDALSEDLHCINLAKQYHVETLPTLVIDDPQQGVTLLEGAWNIDDAIKARDLTHIATYTIGEEAAWQ